MSIQEIKAAITIFEKHINLSAHTFRAEHDYLEGPHSDYMPNLTPEDKLALEQLGWSLNGYNYWQYCCSC